MIDPRRSFDRAAADYEAARPSHPDALLDLVSQEQVQSRDEVLAFARSMSWIAHRPDGERAVIVERLGQLLPPGSYVFPLRAHLQWTVRT